jgi:ribonuclease D
LADVACAASRAPRLALDVEGNGLFAYRPKLCTVQLAWQEAGATHVAIIDSLAVSVAPLRDLLGPAGPVKLLHDCTFDVRMLHEAGIELARVEDTSVTARFLGRQATGLASLLASDLGIQLSKRLQQHDWSQRPLSAEHMEYLAADVAHLADLTDVLRAEASRIGIEAEITEECAYKLSVSLAPPRERRPTYLRIKGNTPLDAEHTAALRSLVRAREVLASELDVPAFRVAPSELLLEMARRMPRTLADLASYKMPFASRHPDAAARLLAAVTSSPEAETDEDSKPEAPPFDRRIAQRRRARQKRLSAWRQAEAEARGVDEQVVLPGHCLSDLVDLEDVTVDAIASVSGIGAMRIERYGEALEALLCGAENP